MFGEECQMSLLEAFLTKQASHYVDNGPFQENKPKLSPGGSSPDGTMLIPKITDEEQIW